MVTSTTGNPDSLQTSFQLKGGLVPMTTLELNYYHWPTFVDQLKRTANQASRFFNRTPVILSVEHLSNPAEIPDFTAIRSHCSRYNMEIVALRGGDPTLQNAAAEAGLALLPAARKRDSSSADDKVVSLARGPVTPPAPERIAPTYVSRPVRSGQQVYAPGDMIVMAQVSTGAELLAEGSIYLYAPLYGRALAGIKGNSDARIFSPKFGAELVSIAGTYTLAGDIASRFIGEAVQVRLEGNSLRFELL